MTLERFPAESEYKRNRKLSREIVKNVLVWSNEKGFTPSISEEDAILFLLSCNYDEEFAKKTICEYYNHKSQNPHLFYNIDPLDDNFSPEKAVGLQYVLPGIGKDGYKVLYTKLVNMNNLKEFSLVREVKMFMCQLDLMIYEMEACPMQTRGIHIVNATSIAKIFFGIIKPFLKSYVLNQLHIHNNLEDLYEYVPKSILPGNIGGDLESAENLFSHSLKHLLDNRDILLSKRIEPKMVQVEESKPKKWFWG